jgi:histidinol-phosphate/aromatic aminotransferase/cobyric acid decarboxylase-like protein
MTSPDLRHHGDVDAAEGLADFAVNVRVPRPPAWLRDRLAAALDDLGRYPSAAAEQRAREAVARRHGRSPDEVLLLNGAAEGFALLPKLTPRRVAIVHPGFTEPEVAFRDAGVPVERITLSGDFTLPAVTADVDLTVIGNPTNPTSVLHAAARVKELPGQAPGLGEAAQHQHAAYAVQQLGELVVVPPKAPFLLVKVPPGTRAALRDKGIAVRRCDTFPGLDDTCVRVAIRPPEEFAVFVDALRVVMEELA